MGTSNHKKPWENGPFWGRYPRNRERETMYSEPLLVISFCRHLLTKETAMTTTRTVQGTKNGPVLHLAFEVGLLHWKLAFTIGLAQAPRLRSVMARDTQAVLREIALAKKRFGLADDAPVVSCYEAGRDGFW